MKVLVVSGGVSSEREVSLRSGKSVGEALMAAGHRVTYFDPGHDTRFLLLRSVVSDVDVVFPALHGTGGEDGTIQGVLEALAVPYVGSSSVVSAQCFDKAQTLKMVHTAGYAAPITDVVTMQTYKKHPLIGQPFVLKPNREGSSIGVLIVRDHKKVNQKAVEGLFARYGTLLIEPYIAGIELTVAVVQGERLPVVEITPPANEEFDYNNKYNGASSEVCPPINIPLAVQEHAITTAQAIHQLLGCRQLSRSDFIYGDDQQLYFLEINTMPGLTPQSLVPLAAQTAGITMSQLTDRLVTAAVSRLTDGRML